MKPIDVGTPDRLVRRLTVAAGASLIVALVATCALVAELSNAGLGIAMPRLAISGGSVTPSSATELVPDNAMAAVRRNASGLAAPSGGIANLPAFRLPYAPESPPVGQGPLAEGIEQYKKKSAAEDVARLTGFIVSTSLSGAAAVADWLAVLASHLIEDRVFAAVYADNGDPAQILAEMQGALSSLGAPHVTAILQKAAADMQRLPSSSDLPSGFPIRTALARSDAPGLPQPSAGLPIMPTRDRLAQRPPSSGPPGTGRKRGPGS